MNDLFRRAANHTSQLLGTPWAFALAIAIVLIWALTGPIFAFADTWQLVINTGTTIITFLMVFLIQNTQNRDSKAIQLKLDELIRGVEGARTNLVHLEDLTDEQLNELQQEFERLHQHGLESNMPVEEVAEQMVEEVKEQTSERAAARS